jgi:hypothetical protein
MPLIYIKLGTATSYFDERTDLELNTTDKVVQALDFLNLNEKLFTDLNAGRIVQVSEQEFLDLTSNIPSKKKLYIPTNDLPTMNEFLVGCPNDNAQLFIFYNNTWYSALWGTLKNCVKGDPVREIFRVGFAIAPYPQPGDAAFTLSTLVGRDPEKLCVKINGVQIYHKTMYQADEWPETDYYELDSGIGAFTRPNVAFQTRDIVDISEVNYPTTVSNVNPLL